MSSMRWQFTSTVWRSQPERCYALEQWQSEDEVLSSVVTSATVQSAPAWKPRRQPPLEAGRLELVFKADERATDALFNSRYGYRAAFARSPLEGEAFNRRIVSLLLARAGSGLDTRMGLSATDEGAKVWMRQDARQTAAIKGRAIYPAELEARDWHRLLEESVETEKGRRWFARAGVLLGTPNGIIELKGGWCIGSVAWQDPDKADRSRCLHLYGFT